MLDSVSRGQSELFREAPLPGLKRPSIVPAVLVLTDSQEVRAAASRAAQHRGLDALHASSEAQAREIIRSSTVHGAFLDEDLLTSSWELVGFLRASTSPSFPLILLTSAPTLEHRIRAVAKGASMSVTRPIDSQELEIALAPLGESGQRVVRECVGDRRRR